MVACVSPSAAHYTDTNNTLRLAARAQCIRTLVSRSSVPTQSMALTPMRHVLPAQVRAACCQHHAVRTARSAHARRGCKTLTLLLARARLRVLQLVLVSGCC